MLTKQQALLKSDELLKRIKLIESFDLQNLFAIYAAGSIFEGFGNSKSDIDIFVIVNKFDQSAIDNVLRIDNDITFHNKGQKKILVTMEDGVFFDIEIYESDYLLEYASRIRSIETSTSDIRYDFFHRLKFSVALFNEDKLKELKEKMNYGDFNTLVAKKHCLYYNTKVTDIMGAFEEKEYDTSFKMCLNLLEECVSAYLSLYGETNPNPKWLLKRIHRFSSTQKEKHLELEKILELCYQNIELNNQDNMKNKTLAILKQCQIVNYECEKKLNEENERK